MTKENMIKYYRKFSACEKYIVGFIFNHDLYFTTMKEIMPKYLNVEKASRNQGLNLRLRMNKTQREKLLPKSIKVGTDKDLIDTVGHLNNKGEIKFWNKGEMFERIITEYFGQVWEKDTVGFWVQGDINVNGVEIQIKLDSATLVDTNRLHSLQKRKVA